MRETLGSVGVEHVLLKYRVVKGINYILVFLAMMGMTWNVWVYPVEEKSAILKIFDSVGVMLFFIPNVLAVCALPPFRKTPKIAITILFIFAALSLIGALAQVEFRPTALAGALFVVSLVNIIFIRQSIKS